MFAGIIEKICTVAAVHAGREAVRLSIDLGELIEGMPFGASVAINGACLTLAAADGAVAGFDVVPETWKTTNLAKLKVGDEVNAERALRLGDRIDGHFVQGHVDGLGRVDRIETTGGEHKIWIACERELSPYIVRKGSIAIDGVSLTVAAVEPGRFSVALIPTTLEQTVLRSRKPGDSVNLETDVLARLVVARLDSIASQSGAPVHAGLSLQRLQESGFLP